MSEGWDLFMLKRGVRFFSHIAEQIFLKNDCTIIIKHIENYLVTSLSECRAGSIQTISQFSHQKEDHLIPTDLYLEHLKTVPLHDFHWCRYYFWHLMNLTSFSFLHKIIMTNTLQYWLLKPLFESNFMSQIYTKYTVVVFIRDYVQGLPYSPGGTTGSTSSTSIHSFMSTD